MESAIGGEWRGVAGELEVAEDAADGGGGVGTTQSRSLELGANTPWKRVRLNLGGGTRAASIAGGSTPGAPAVNITAPGERQLVQGTVPVTAEVNDPSGSITVVEFFLHNQATPFATDNVAPLSVQWNSDPVSEGAHVLRVKAANAAGMSGTDTVNVLVRTKPATNCFTATNTEHAAAGRARAGTTTSLEQMSPGYFEKVASCP